MDNSFLSLSQGISTYITSSMSRGTVFFTEDLDPLNIDPFVLRTTLSRMVQEGTLIVRLARGVFCYPRLEEYSMKVILPPLEAVAEALAARWHVRIAPCGAQAAYLAGLTGLQTHPLTYISDGSAQHFNLQNGRRIEFIRRKSVKVFSFRNERLRNLVEGLRYLGKENVGEFELGVAKATLPEIPSGDFFHDIRLAPVWIQDTLRSLLP